MANIPLRRTQRSRKLWLFQLKKPTLRKALISNREPSTRQYVRPGTRTASPLFRLKEVSGILVKKTRRPRTEKLKIRPVPTAFPHSIRPDSFEIRVLTPESLGSDGEPPEKSNYQINIPVSFPQPARSSWGRAEACSKGERKQAPEEGFFDLPGQTPQPYFSACSKVLCIS